MKVGDLTVAAAEQGTPAQTAQGRTVSEVAVSVAEPAAAKPRSVAEPGSLIPIFARLYERGDLDRFMELFDDNARNESGGKTKIRRDYEELFAITVNRQVIIWDMVWAPKDNVWFGEGRFQVRVQRKNESFLRMYEGTLRLDLVAVGDHFLIRGIYHKLDRGNN
jgi:TorA maturation chaperone TorD